MTTTEPEAAYVRITVADLHRALVRVEQEVLGIRHLLESTRNQTLDHEARLRLAEDRRIPLPLVPIMSALVAICSAAIAAVALLTK